MEEIIQQFLPTAKLQSFEKLTGGLIHQTNKVVVDLDGVLKVFVLQQFNANTFKMPFKVMENLGLVQDYLARQNYPLQIAKAFPTIQNTFLFSDSNNNLWRLFPFLENSTSFETPESDDHLFQAGKAYGIFLTALKGFDVKQLEITIPDFHNLTQRFESFKKLAEHGSLERRQIARIEIQKVFEYYKRFHVEFSDLPIRAVHNDSKMSNLLFDRNTQECIAVIDLDTLMPGYVVTDFGDMVRGMCNTSFEDEQNLSKVSFDVARYELLKTGFLSATKKWLTEEEMNNLLNGAIYIILEQAIRFLGDYLEDDKYYTINYPAHNYHRASNQLKLFSSMIEQMV